MTIQFVQSAPFSESSTMEQAAQTERSRLAANRMENSEMCRVIGPTKLEGMTACSCCNRRLSDERQTVGETDFANRHSSLFQNESSDDDSTEDMDDNDHMMPGVLSYGVPYTVKKTLVQGWVHKKGTGMDWIGSRGWKPRWASLVLASIVGRDADVPLLLIYWHSSSPSPSTVILLDTTVVLPEDLPDKSKWNCFRFQIRYAKNSDDSSSVPVTRTFSCPQEGRDAWVYAINQSLLDFEKQKAKARKSAITLSHSLPTTQSLTWTTDKFPAVAKRRLLDLPPRTPSPPTSPRLQTKRPLPRPQAPLLGEALLTEASN